jgi:hypothetical protein
MDPSGGAPGELLMAELRWVHGALRHDLAVCRSLAEDVSEGAPAELVQGAVRSLQTSGPLWQTRVSCLRYCRFVHAHHGAEDVALFPTLRAANPELAPVIDRLEADHRDVAGLLDAVEDAADALGGDDGPAARERLAGALDALATRLLEHLDFELASLAPAVLRWEQWPAPIRR